MNTDSDYGSRLFAELRHTPFGEISGRNFRGSLFFVPGPGPSLVVPSGQGGA